jgi:hypothetical protein
MPVITFTGKRIPVPSLGTIADLKAYIWTHERIPVDLQKLLQHGSVCADLDPVVTDAIYYLVVNLRGGMFHATSGRQDYNKEARYK